MSHTNMPESGSRNETRFRKMLPSDLVAFQQLKLICHFYFEAILARTDRKNVSTWMKVSCSRKNSAFLCVVSAF